MSDPPAAQASRHCLWVYFIVRQSGQGQPFDLKGKVLSPNKYFIIGGPTEPRHGQGSSARPSPLLPLRCPLPREGGGGPVAGPSEDVGMGSLT